MGNKKNRSRVDLKAEIEKELERSGYKRSYRETSFVSLDSIADIFKPSNLQRSLKKDLETLRKEGLGQHMEGVKIEKLEAHVREAASKVYAVLLLVGQPQKIVQLYNTDHPVTDRMFEQVEGKNDVPYCSLEYLQATPFLEDIAQDFFEKQWLIPPILRGEMNPKFPIGPFRFPFLDAPEQIGKGGYAQVFKVKIADGHLKASGEGYVRGSVVAYKEITKSRDVTEEKLMREVNTIRAREHQNIVRYFASFSAGRENPWHSKDKTECLHMLFEHTDAGNMHDWLHADSAPTPLADVAKRQEYITTCIESLVSAVTFIHAEINSFIAYHHDLKPKNILLFKGPPQVWKICDFGMANLKHHQAESGTTQRPHNRFGTYEYQPPEYFTNEKDPKHGRPFDVYSLGCIILELATVWKYGWSTSGIARFRSLRGSNEEHACLDGAGKPKPPERDYSFHNSPKVVEGWIQQLGAGEDKDSNFSKILGLVSEMLVARSQRIFVWEINMDLYEMGGQRSQTQLQNYLRKIVQPSTTPLNDLNNEHNPLKRAKRRDKQWQYPILEENKWSVTKPMPSKELTIKRRETEIYHTTLTDYPLPIEFERNSYFGRHDMDEKISQGLKESNCVGLFGMSGGGKSHLAYHYVVRFRDTNTSDHRKHTFWIEAGNETRFRQTVSRIAQVIEPRISESEDSFHALRKWLSDPLNGPWIMVVDGLDNSTVAKMATSLLPRDTGQILITTKNRDILDGMGDFFVRKRKETVLPLEELTEDNARLIFQWYNDDVLPNRTDMKNLLEKLGSPVLIKMVAKYLRDKNIPTSDLHKAMESGNCSKFLESVLKDPALISVIFEHLLPYTPRSTRLHKWPSPLLKLLGELSCLNKDEMDFTLIQQNYENEMKLREMLGVLENCAYISKKTTGDSSAYCMHEMTQALVRSWVINSMGHVKLLELHTTALCMLLTLYSDEKKKEPEAQKVRRSSYLWKLPFMIHFEQFLAFARDYAARGKVLNGFDCPDRMAQSVITFSQVFLDEGRYDDAACVLDFTRKLYKRFQYRPELARTLSKAYTLSPLARTYKDGWDESASFLKDVIQECDDRGESKQKWMCVLDLAHLYSKSLWPKEASRALKCLREVYVGKKTGKPCLYIRGKRIFDDETELKLAIFKRIAEAKIHLARAKCSASPKVIRTELEKAREAFTEAKLAIKNSFSEEDRWMLEMDEGIAETLCRTGEPESIKEAINIFERMREEMHRVSGGESKQPARAWRQKRVWDIECRIACAQLHLGPEVQAAAIKKLQQNLKLYEGCYEERGGQHDDHTRACAHHLCEAYKRAGKVTEAREIERRYSLHLTKDIRLPEAVIESPFTIKWADVCILLVVMSFLMYFLQVLVGIWQW